MTTERPTRTDSDTSLSPPAGPPLSGLHLLLTYECNFECDHCFVWSGPGKNGTMKASDVDNILGQAVDLGTIEWIYFEGGEPFLHASLLRAGIDAARSHGFRVGIVTNAFWATSEESALATLRPLVGAVDDLSISDDAYHGSSKEASGETGIARRAAETLRIPTEFISVAGPEETGVEGAAGQLPPGECAVLFRGRAAETLAGRVPATPWRQFDRCPWEELRYPERVHVDAFGHVHVCQGISIGNLFERQLADIMHGYRPDTHPIVGPLLDGGPAEFVNRYGLDHAPGYADACHLCYAMRCRLRSRFPAVLAPDQMYGGR